MSLGGITYGAATSLNGRFREAFSI